VISTTENNPINLDSILNAAEIDPGETPAEQDVNTIAIRIDDAIVLHHATDETQVCFKCRGLEWLREPYSGCLCLQHGRFGCYWHHHSKIRP